MRRIKYIKELVEANLEIEDLSTKSKKRQIVYARFLCFKLGKVFTKHSLAEIASPFKKDHATVLNGLKQFDILFDQYGFEEIKELYIKLSNHLEKAFKSDERLKDIDTVENLKIHYRMKHLELIDKSHRVIGRLLNKVNTLTKNNDLFDELSSLSESDFEDFEHRTRAFLNMLKTKQYVHRKTN